MIGYRCIYRDNLHLYQASNQIGQVLCVANLRDVGYGGNQNSCLLFLGLHHEYVVLVLAGRSSRDEEPLVDARVNWCGGVVLTRRDVELAGFGAVGRVRDGNVDTARH